MHGKTKDAETTSGKQKQYYIYEYIAIDIKLDI